MKSLILFLVAFQPRIANMPPSTPQQQREAIEYSKTVINPILAAHASDPKELPAIKDRLWYIARQSTANKLSYQAVAVRNPWLPSSIAKIDYDYDKKLPALMAFVPQIEQDRVKFNWSARPQDFEDYLVLAFAHEVIHLELLAKNPQYELANREGWPVHALRLQNEAEAWGITILEILRPMMAKGRWVPKTMADASVMMSGFGDNYRDPRWIEAFTVFHPR